MARLSAGAHELVHRSCEAAGVSFSEAMQRAIEKATQYVDGLPAWSGEHAYLSVRLDPDERAAVQAAAEACGLHPTVWLRLIATANHTPLLEQLRAARRVMP